jgi:hypothetical protein
MASEVQLLQLLQPMASEVQLRRLLQLLQPMASEVQLLQLLQPMASEVRASQSSCSQTQRLPLSLGNDNQRSRSQLFDLDTKASSSSPFSSDIRWTMDHGLSEPCSA